MKVRTINGREIDDGLRTRWAQIQASDPCFASPYFCAEFTEAVSAVRDDVYVGVIESGNRVVGFFPHHRRSIGHARPVGLGLSDYHGVVIEPEIEWSVEQLLRDCGLDRWEYDHLIASQEQFAPFHSSVEPSPIIDVSRGFEAYEAQRMEMGGTEMKTVYRRIRKLARECETHRFVADELNDDRLEQLFRLKSSQCRESGAYDYFSLPWTKELIRNLLRTKSDSFSGALSSLYVGDECVAVHFGIRSNTVWHWWLPNYEKSFSKYSVGLILLLELTKQAAADGLRYVDLGKDVSRYKANLMTGAVDVACGCVTRPSAWNALSEVGRWIERGARRPLLRPLLRVPAAVLRRANRRLRYD